MLEISTNVFRRWFRAFPFVHSIERASTEVNIDRVEL
jgi:hypothetical protein